jgi:hypothetical protein
MKDPDLRESSTAAIREASMALAELRDALGELSLALKDWLFEADHEYRRMAEDSTQKLLKRCSGVRQSGG